MRLDSVQRVDNAERLLDILGLLPSHPDKLVLRLAAERERVDLVAEVVLLAALEVRDEVVDVLLVRLETPPR